MADGKWITGINSATSLQAAARLALEARLGAVLKHLPKAMHKAHEDVEHVHQLRVATRRARAAIDLFADCIAEKCYKRLRKILRRLRRLAGDARDCDVFLARLRDPLAAATPREVAGLHWIAGNFSATRAHAQAKLTEGGAAAREQLDSLLSDACDELQANAGGAPSRFRLPDHARPHLLELIHKLEERATGDARDLPQLHQIRIQGKRLRYAIEVFAKVFPTSLSEEIHPQVEGLQEILGRINDHSVAVERLTQMRSHARQFEEALWPTWRPGVESLLRTERKQLANERKHYERFWQTWCRNEVGQRLRDIISE